MDRTTLRETRVIERRPAVTNSVQRSAAAHGRSPSRTVQQRLGNQATQALIARSIASRERERTAEGSAAVGVTTPPTVQLSRTTRLPAKV